MIEDEHYQIYINNHDFDLILRSNDENTEHTSWDLFDYTNQRHVYTCYDMELARALLEVDRYWAPRTVN